MMPLFSIYAIILACTRLHTRVLPYPKTPLSQVSSVRQVSPLDDADGVIRQEFDSKHKITRINLD